MAVPIAWVGRFEAGRNGVVQNAAPAVNQRARDAMAKDMAWTALKNILLTLLASMLGEMFRTGGAEAREVISWSSTDMFWIHVVISATIGYWVLGSNETLSVAITNRVNWCEPANLKLISPSHIPIVHLMVVVLVCLWGDRLFANIPFAADFTIRVVVLVATGIAGYKIKNS